MAYFGNPYQQPYGNPYGYPQMGPQGVSGASQPFGGQVTRVNGRNGAEALRMAPNSSILLMDENEPIVWLKQTDGAGYATVTLYKDGVAVPGATASETGAANGTVNLSIPALVRQACRAAGFALTLVLTGAAATVNNVALRVQRI